MQTPIDFGKDFLNRLFDEQDLDACLKMLAGDLVWITPEDMHHFLSKEAVLSFLKKQASDGRPMYVDLISIKSSPSADNIMTVAYEVNLVSEEDEKKGPLYLRCSMAICRRGGQLEITFLHFSERSGGAGVQQLHDLIANLPCGVMILACLDDKGEEAVFYNGYFARRLRYRQEEFAKKIQKNPFFMAPEEDREKIREELAKGRKSGGLISANLRFCRRDGNIFHYKMTGAPAWEADGGAMYYCVFQETTGLKLVEQRLQSQLDMASGILRQLPEAVCAIECPGGECPGAEGAKGLRAAFVSRNIPSLFGVSASAYTKGILADPFFGLEITSITRDKLMSSHVLNREKAAIGKPVSCGIFRIEREEGKSIRVELVLRRTMEKDGNGYLYLFYYDREAQQREVEERIERAAKLGRAGQEQLRVQLEKTKENAARTQSELRSALKEEKKKNAGAVSRAEKLLAQERERSALLEARLEEAEAALRKLAQEHEKSEADAARTLRNMLQKSEEDAQKKLQSLLREAREDARKKILAEKEEAGRRIRKIQAEADRRVKEAERRAQGQPTGEAPGGKAPAGRPGRLRDAGRYEFETFSPEDCIMEILDMEKETCAVRELSLKIHFDTGLPEAVSGFGSLLRAGMQELVENAILRSQPGGVVSVHCRSDRPFEGLVNLAFRVDDYGPPISDEEMRTIFRAQPLLLGDPEKPWTAEPEKDGGYDWEMDLEKKEEPAPVWPELKDPALSAGLDAVREAAALMGGSVHARSSTKGTRFLLNVALHVQTGDE